MKKSILVVSAVVALALIGCEEKSYIDGPGSNVNVPDSIPVTVEPEPTPDPEGVEVPEGTINVYEALKIGKKLKSGETTEETYYIKGWVNSFDAKERAKSDFEDKFKQYGNDYVYLSTRNDGLSTKLFYCYRLLGKNGAPLPDHEAMQIGDFVVVKCQIQNYSGTIESSGTCSTYSSSNEHFNESFKPGDTIHATCAEAKTAALALSSGGVSKDIYVVEGYVQSAGYDATISKGQQKWFWIDDTPSGGKVLEAYWCNVPDGTTPVPVGAKIRLTGNLMNYNGTTAEIKNGDIEILEAAEN